MNASSVFTQLHIDSLANSHPRPGTSRLHPRLRSSPRGIRTRISVGQHFILTRCGRSVLLDLDRTAGPLIRWFARWQQKLFGGGEGGRGFIAFLCFPESRCTTAPSPFLSLSLSLCLSLFFFSQTQSHSNTRSFTV
ncbi:unnamed protein product [Protopolystoma xenopodis]|uniref:Uncharacterized protein n=1 Tax=Protopolystoma xenopodis TaxID=117903 RepID=A0A448X3Y1_9PLAT|nr:unnamed protein product [Protopolystoma xenopodis]